MLKKKDKILYYYFSKSFLKKLKNKLNIKRNYKYDYNIERYDFIFHVYKNFIIKKFLEISELKKALLKKRLKKRVLKAWIFKKLFIKALVFRIRNELLLTMPDLLYFHKRLKSWKIIKSKYRRKYRKNKRYLYKRRKKWLRNLKILKLSRYPTYREAVDLKLKLSQLYFWLRNTTKRQVMLVRKWNKLQQTRNNVKNYFRIKKRFFKKSFFLKKKKIKIYKYFLRKNKFYFINVLNNYFNNYLKLMIFLSFLLKKDIYFKFFFFKNFKIFIYYFRRTLIKKLLKVGMFESFKELKLKRKFKIKWKIKKKLLFSYRLSKYLHKIYKLKVRMVNSNFFITLTDNKDKVIISRSTGQVSNNRKKKVKLSPLLVTKMMFKILNKLKILKIKYMYIYINTKINIHIKNVVKILKDFKYVKILKFFFSKPIAHHRGLRKPKLRRL